ncbi:uncharacterized protein LOC110893393 [Helianthus annuus]|uniref:uncharacterized protein LOC110893393 n=1 Tax=Helianthus annuus TaxID=4232 RepID=UPI000B8FCBAC|nr:uncharacterized protein LOC110893393 [Helianthus annuus]
MRMATKRGITPTPKQMLQMETGNRLPFPVVEYYAKNVWTKFGFLKVMMNESGFFFFKFDSKDGLMKVLEGGPWLIRKVPLFLNVWSPKITLKKDCIKTVPIWVKLHNVPIAAYTDDGLSLLASKLGTPKRLDSYTADMCVDNWGRSSFARAMIEINADNDLKDHITVAIPKMDEEGFILERVKVEYEWRPLRCSSCCLFGHDDHSCPNKPNEKAKGKTVDDEGFVTDNRRLARHSFPQRKQKQKVVYRPKVNKSQASTSGTKGNALNEVIPNAVNRRSDEKPVHKEGKSVNGNGSKETGLNLRNSFSALSGNMDGDPVTGASFVGDPITIEDNDDGVLESLPTEISEFMAAGTNTKPSEGASTPGSMGING